VEPDPPDIRVWCNGSPVVELEFTEYHVNHEEVATSDRWANLLWPKVDELRRKDDALKAVGAWVNFFDTKLPSLGKKEIEQFANELVELARQVTSTLGSSEDLKISFSPRSTTGKYPVIQCGWHRFPGEDWPLISLHLNTVKFTKTPVVWPRWHCYQTDSGWMSLKVETFGKIFEDKERKVRNKLGAGIQTRGVPLWLVIVSDLLNDLSSHVFPSNEWDSEELFRIIRATGYDFAGSPFSQVWLFSEFTRQKIRLDPNHT
jgi:hypothetical protein